MNILLGEQLTVQLNEVCNLHCSYCMASVGNGYMSKEDLDYLKDFILRNKIKLIKITGGEPSLYPYFIEFINWLLSKNISCLIFSNLTTNVNLEQLMVPSSGYCKFLVNVSEKDLLSEGQLKIRNNNVDVLIAKGISVNVSCTIFDANFEKNLKNAVSYAQKYKSEILRISVANPKCDGQNVFLSPLYYESVLKGVLSMIDLWTFKRVIWDCALPKCLFTKEVYSLAQEQLEITSICSPRFNINYKLGVEHCYVVDGESSPSIYDFNNLDELKVYILNAYEKMNVKLSPFEECHMCEHKQSCSACYGLRGLLNGGSIKTYGIFR